MDIRGETRALEPLNDKVAAGAFLVVQRTEEEVESEEIGYFRRGALKAMVRAPGKERYT